MVFIQSLISRLSGTMTYLSVYNMYAHISMYKHTYIYIHMYTCVDIYEYMVNCGWDCSGHGGGTVILSFSNAIRGTSSASPIIFFISGTDMTFVEGLLGMSGGVDFGFAAV